MVILDRELQKREERGAPIRVGVIGAGYMGEGIVTQLLRPPVGMRLGAVSNRTIGKAERLLLNGTGRFVRAGSPAEVDQAVARGEYAVTDNSMCLCDAENIDVIVDATSDIEFGAQIAMRAMQHGKHVVLNAILDATVGPILKTYADRYGVVLTYTDGDEPGVAANLVRFVKGIGYEPVAAGNIKGLLDPHRTPDTQKAFAERVNQSAEMITSFADGTKLAVECAILANATGFKAGKRGMYGPRCAHIREAASFFPTDQLLNGGLVDFVLGAEPGTGAWVIGYNEGPVNRRYMEYFKMGEGPFHVFHTPFHLPHLQILDTIARAALFQDATVTPLDRPVCDVLAVAKRDLKAGEVLGPVGGFDYYGVLDDANTVLQEELLPVGLAAGQHLSREVRKDHPISYRDIATPRRGRLCDALREEQDARFFAAIYTHSAAASSSSLITKGL
jgi:predicted homoserine dehydrogenase-like protein